MGNKQSWQKPQRVFKSTTDYVRKSHGMRRIVLLCLKSCIYSFNRLPAVCPCLTVCYIFLTFSLLGGGRKGLSKGERSGRIGVAESDIISDIAIGQALTNIVRGRVQRGGLRQEVGPSSCIMRTLQTNNGNENIIIVLLSLLGF